MKRRRELSSREVEALHERLARRLGDSSVPTLPHIAVKIIELVGNPSSSMQDLAEVIQTDQALTGRLLRLTNSAYFGQSKPVTTLQRAAVLIGLERLKAMALGFHLSKVASTGQSGERRLWTLALFRGWYALRLAEKLNKLASGEAFVVGLMMDVGLPQMSMLEGVSFEAIYDGDEPPAKKFLAEMDELAFTHVDVAAALCKVWKLPTLIARPICLHHNPAPPASANDPGSILHAVAYFIGALPLDPGGGPRLEAKFSRVGQRLLGLDEAALLQAASDAAKDVEASRDYFSHLMDASLSIDSILGQANGLLSNAVEEMVGEAIAHGASGHCLSLQAGSCRLELEARGSGTVRIYLHNASGDRLLSEDVDGARIDGPRLCRQLMLEGLPESDLHRLVSSVRALAA